MLDQGEYLGNFVICKENSVLNDDFTWTVYQNDQLRNLFNRTTREGKRLFCKVDQIGISEAYEQRVLGTVMEDQLLPTKPTYLVFDATFGLMFYDLFKQPLDTLDHEYHQYQNGNVLHGVECVSSIWTGVVDNRVVLSVQINGKSLTEILAELNQQLDTRYPNLGMSFRQPSTRTLEIIWTEPSKWLCPFPADAEYYTAWIKLNTARSLSILPANMTLKPEDGPVLGVMKSITDTEKIFTYGNVREMVIPQAMELQRVPVAQIGNIPISTQTVYWHHPDLTFSSLNLNPLTGLAHNNELTIYNQNEGSIYELIQMSPKPKLSFFVMSSTTDENEWSVRQPVLVSDFHIQLSFYKYPGDFSYNEMKYLGNFVMGQENTRIDYEAQTLEVYQNDKVRALLDKTTKKGKKLYAKVDQVAFEEVPRKDEYQVTLHEFRIDRLWKRQQEILTQYITVSTRLYDNDLWLAISNKLNETTTNLTYSIRHESSQGLIITVSDIPPIKDELIAEWEHQWEILFDKDLCEDYNLSSSYSSLSKRIKTTYPEGDDKPYTQEYVTKRIHMGRNASFTTNHMYFYHPDLVGDNCNLEPITIACTYPGTTHYNQPQYYFIRSLSAPTYIQFFYWTTERVDGEWKSVKKYYLPTNFHVVLSFYEGD